MLFDINFHSILTLSYLFALYNLTPCLLRQKLSLPVDVIVKTFCCSFFFIECNTNKACKFIFSCKVFFYEQRFQFPQQLGKDNYIEWTYDRKNEMWQSHNTLFHSTCTCRYMYCVLTSIWSTDTGFWLAGLFRWWCRIDSLMLFFYWLFHGGGRSRGHGWGTCVGEEWYQSMPRKHWHRLVRTHCR